MTLKQYIRTIPDHPKKGILFRDITTLLNNAEGLKRAVDMLIEHYRDIPIDRIATIEARGFVFAAPLAYALNKPLVLIRKKGKLPGETIAEDYSLEYGTNTIEITTDALKPNEKVLIIDDLIATGGTAAAAVNLVRKCNANVVGCAFAIDLPDLGGAKHLESIDCPVFTLCAFEGK